MSNAVDEVVGTPDENTASFLDVLSLRAGEENLEKNVESVVPNSKPVPEKVLSETSSPEATESLKVVNETESKALNNSEKNINENSIKVDDTTTSEVKPSDKTPVAEDLQPSPQPSFGDKMRIKWLNEVDSLNIDELPITKCKDLLSHSRGLLPREHSHVVSLQKRVDCFDSFISKMYQDVLDLGYEYNSGVFKKISSLKSFSDKLHQRVELYKKEALTMNVQNEEKFIDNYKTLSMLSDGVDEVLRRFNA